MTDAPEASAARAEAGAAEPATVPAAPGDFGYSRFALRIWHGMTFGAWMRLMRGNLHKVSPSRYGLVASVTALSLGNSVLKHASRLLYGRRLERVEIRPDPVFILGHWRSGTTWLHQVMASDPRFAAPTAMQCFNPEGFLASQALMRGIMRLALPRRRPMDEVGFSTDGAEEDEFALLLGGAQTPYRHIAFPCDPLGSADTGPDTLAPGDAAFWRATWLGFLRTVQFVNPGRRLLLKSPLHTLRIAEILRHFPNARFVHIVRDPYKTYLSREHSLRAMAATQGLQDRVPAGPANREWILNSFVNFQERFEADRGAIPPRHLVSIRYEDLRADTLGLLRRVYDALGLGDFATAEPSLVRVLEARKGYRTNALPLPADLEAEIDARWRAYFERYGYRRLSDRAAAP